MEAGQKKKTWDTGRFRRERKTFWPRSHPVMFPHIHTDHWSKMKTMVPDYVASFPVALLKDKGETASNPFPPVTENAAHDPPMGRTYSTSKNSFPPQNLLQYRNVFNDRARMGFCYWLVEKKHPACKGYSFGAYKTSLGLPKL